MPSWITPVALYMLKGLAVTCELALVSGIAALTLGVVLGLLLVTENKLLKRAITLYVELWRGLPLLVILFFAFFALPGAGVRLTGFQVRAPSGLSYGPAPSLLEGMCVAPSRPSPRARWRWRARSASAGSAPWA